MLHIVADADIDDILLRATAAQKILSMLRQAIALRDAHRLFAPTLHLLCRHLIPHVITGFTTRRHTQLLISLSHYFSHYTRPSSSSLRAETRFNQERGLSTPRAASN